MNTVAKAAHEDVVLFTGGSHDEAAIKIVDEIGSAPIEMGEDGGRGGGDQAADHQACESDGEEFEHGGEGDVVAEEFGVEIRKGFAGCRRAWGRRGWTPVR